MSRIINTFESRKSSTVIGVIVCDVTCESFLNYARSRKWYVSKSNRESPSAPDSCICMREFHDKAYFMSFVPYGEKSVVSFGAEGETTKFVSRFMDYFLVCTKAKEVEDAALINKRNEGMYELMYTTDPASAGLN